MGVEIGERRGPGGGEGTESRRDSRLRELEEEEGGAREVRRCFKEERGVTF